MSGNEAAQHEVAQQEAVQEEVVEIKVIQGDLDDKEMKIADKEEEKLDKKGKKSSKAWDYFKELKGCPIGFEKVKCTFCKVVIGCNTNRNGTLARRSQNLKCPAYGH